jgi:hypothetical protein
VDFFVSHRPVLFNVLTATSNEAALIVTTLLDSLKVTPPVICDVRPTASLWAGKKPSFSRTR